MEIYITTTHGKTYNKESTTGHNSLLWHFPYEKYSQRIDSLHHDGTFFFRFPWPVPVDLHNTQPKDVFIILCTTIRKKTNARLQTKLKQLRKVCSFNI